MPRLKLLKFPTPLERGAGKRNVALLARRAKNDRVRSVVCFYETDDGQSTVFWGNAPVEKVVAACAQIQHAVMQDIYG